MKSGNYPGNPALSYVRALLGAHLAALRTAWRDADRGAARCVPSSALT